jgi:hypothetical protein
MPRGLKLGSVTKKKKKRKKKKAKAPKITRAPR